MGYLHDFRAELEHMLAKLAPEERDAIVTFVSARVYESYKNGRAAGATPEPRETATPKVKGRRPYKR